MPETVLGTGAKCCGQDCGLCAPAAPPAPVDVPTVDLDEGDA